MPCNLISLFNSAAGEYDLQRNKLIPCFDDFYGIACSLAEASIPNPSVLDLGAGTGLMSALIAGKYPESRITLIDIAEEMLLKARERLSGFTNTKFIVADYVDYDFAENYDIIVSALSIHHLEASVKAKLYNKCFKLLKPGGILINADQVMGASEYLENLYKSDWKKKVEASGLSREVLDSAYERVRLDKMSTLIDQLDWINAAGFTDADCVYKYYNFTVMAARKPL